MIPSVQELLKQVAPLRHANQSLYGGYAQSLVIPEATYSPWLQDEEFLAAYREVRANTVVDIYRCYELWQLARQLARIDGDILEVGVFRGGSGCLLARAAHHGDRTKHVFLCDTYAGIAKAGPEDSYFKGGELANTSVDMVRGLVEKLALSNVSILKGIFPDETASAVKDRQFSLCHIDVDVYLSARDVLDWVWPRLSVGGVVVFDDYGFWTCDGIVKIVNERIGQMNATTIHNLNGHAIMTKTSA